MSRRLLATAAALLVLVGCGYDADESTAPDTTEGPFPPATAEELAEVLDPQLETLGVRFTRGALIDRSDGGYEPSEEGTHLALYVEPIDEDTYDTADYVEGVETITALVTPEVFDRWSAVETYDICQEPPTSVSDAAEPPPYTQIEIGRAQAEAIDWEDATLETVIASSLTGDLRLVVTQAVRDHPDYQAAEDAATGSVPAD